MWKYCVFLIALFGVAYLFKSKHGTEFISIGTGAVTGVYHGIGDHICGVINNERSTYRCSTVSTSGSIQNINALLDGVLDIAIVQPDVLYKEYKKHPELRQILQLHTETLTMYTRKNSGIKNFSQASHRIVNIGAPGSGIYSTMRDVLSEFHMSPTVTNLPLNEQGDGLCNKRIDVAINFSGHPNSAIQETGVTCDIAPVSLDDYMIENLTKKYKFYSKAIVPHAWYASFDSDAKTIGAKAIFVVRKSLNDDVVRKFVDTVKSNIDAIAKSRASIHGLQKKDILPSMKFIPQHKALD